MRRAAAVLATLALLAAGCGGNGDGGAKIPATLAEDMKTLLRQVNDDVAAKRCGGARFKLDQLAQKVDQLPRDVSAEVRSNIEDGVARLRTLALAECMDEEQPATTTEETTETTAPTTEETQPPTTTEETTDTQPPPAGEPPPPPPPPAEPLPTPTNPSGGAGAPGEGE